jgi:hypothetical protein
MILIFSLTTEVTELDILEINNNATGIFKSAIFDWLDTPQSDRNYKINQSIIATGVLNVTGNVET